MPGTASSFDPVVRNPIDSFSQQILDWYEEHQRPLPWRVDSNPYRVWISEIMLQQTRVDTVIPYYLRWMERFPTIEALASASEQEVLKTWEGLGYYSRARNLHKAAQVLWYQFEGEIPSRKTELENLPGIGPYTAGAIASIACGMDEPVLDGNVMRVYARIFDIKVPVRSNDGQSQLKDISLRMLPKGSAGNYNQALMDLGATICLPLNPACEFCPVRSICQSFALQNQADRPVREKRRKIPQVIVTAAIIWRDGTVLIARRPSEGLLGGMWEFPGGKLESGEDLEAGLKREIQEELGVEVLVGQALGIFRHAYTHFKVILHAFLCELQDGEPTALEASEIRWVRLSELTHYPMGKIDRQISLKLLED